MTAATIAPVRSQLQRVRGLLDRYRVDRRLPPTVADLFRSTFRLQLRDRRDRVAARMRPSLNAGSASPSDVAVLGSRRVRTAGPLAMSTHELGHHVAGAVSSVLTEAEIAHFLTRQRGDGLSFAVQLTDRDRALDVLTRTLGQAWYLEWADGTRTGLAPLADAATDRHAQRARSWLVFRAHSWADHAVGRDQGAELTFWDTGSSGLLEQIGTRSQERYDPRSPATVEVLDGRTYPGNAAFPVADVLERMTDPVDIVYTWVDGADPDWQAELRSTAGEQGRAVDESALDPARFRSREELRYSLRSVWAYCGWARRIWIVTAGQRPDWLDDDERIRVVHHSEILPDSALPTFNSHAIEASLHHIDGLAEHFVYFNDDMLIARPTRPELFFTSSGLPRVFQSSARPPGIEDAATIHVDTAALRGRELLAERFGRVAIAKPHHSPYPLSSSTSRAMEAEFTEIIEQTRHSRFRARTDLSTAASFAQHYALATGRAVLGELRTEYVHVESGRLATHLERIRLGDNLDTYCINETGELEGDHRSRELRIAEFFEAVLPIPAPWER